MGLIPCRTCNKTGKRTAKVPCPKCGGYGLVRDKDDQFVSCPNTSCKGGQVEYEIDCPACKGVGMISA